MGIFDKIFSKKVTREDFTKKMLEALKRADAGQVTYNSEERSVRMGTRGQTIYLDNAYSDYCAVEPAQRNTVLEKYASTFLQPMATAKDFAAASASLLPSVKDPAYFSLASLMLESQGKDVTKFRYQTKAIVEGLEACVAQDTPQNIMNVNASTLEGWGVGFEQALEVAVNNLREKTDVKGLEAIAPGFYVSKWGDSYDSSRVLLPEIFYRLSLNGDPVVFLPNRDQMMVIGQYDQAGITTMLTHGRASHFEQGHALSPNLYLHREGKWRLYLPEDPTARKLALDMRRERAAKDYAQQKEYLENLHNRQKRDIFVASFTVLEDGQKNLGSISVWTRGVDTLLPITEELALLTNLESKKVVRARWEVAATILDGLLVEEPGLYPRRMRAREFPSEAQISELEKAGK